MRRVTPVLIAALALVASACGGNAGGTTTATADTSTTTTAPAPTTTTTIAATTTTQASTTTTAAPTTTTAVATTTTAPSGTTTSLAGQPIDFGPAAGDVLMVIGVRHNDVLNLRAGPGTAQRVLAGIPPTFTNLKALGNTRQLPASFWTEVDFNGTVGWVSMRFIGYEGEVTDDTAAVIAELGERPTKATMTALADEVAKVYASQSPQSAIVQVTPVTSGDLTEVSYDVIGLGDDSVGGFRLHIFAEQVSGGFTLRSVEATVICLRGVDADRLCV